MVNTTSHSKVGSSCPQPPKLLPTQFSPHSIVATLIIPVTQAKNLGITFDLLLLEYLTSRLLENLFYQLLLLLTHWIELYDLTNGLL